VSTCFINALAMFKKIPPNLNLKKRTDPEEPALIN
jgi:hypothetical protein